MKKKLLQKMAIVIALALVIAQLSPVSSKAATVVSPKLNATSKTLFIGKSYDFGVVNKIAGSKYAWSISNSKVASVDKSTGLVTAVAPGTAKVTCLITAKEYKKELTATVTVKQNATAITINNYPENKTMMLGETFDFNRKLTPKTATDGTYWILSKNTANATIDKNGVVTPKNQGEFTIKAVTASSKANYDNAVITSQSPTITITVKAEVQEKPEITSITTTDSKTIVIGFNQEISTTDTTASNFSIVSEYNSLQTIEKVTVSDSKVTIKLYNSLDSSSYNVTIKDVKSAKNSLTADTITKSITYTKQSPASIEIISDTVKVGEQIKYIIKDSLGNDITQNYTITDLEIGSSDESIVTTGLDTLATGTDVVISIKIKQTNIEIKNKLINVVTTTTTPETISDISLGGWGTNTLSLFKSQVESYFSCSVKDNNGVTIATFVNGAASDNSKFEFTSLNPTILGVENNSGKAYAISKGTASVVIKATINNKIIQKTVQIVIKDDPYLSSIKVAKSIVKVVKDSGVISDLGIELIDQYGSTYTGQATVVFSINDQSKFNVSDGYGDISSNSIIKIADGKATLSITEKEGATIGNATINIASNGRSTNATLSLVSAGKFAKYQVVISNKTLDINTSIDGLPVGKTIGEKTTSVEVYKLDSNGNYMGYASNVSLVDSNTVSTSPVTVMSYNDHSGAITAENVGIETVTVYVGSAAIETIPITVVNSKPVITKINQIRTEINVKTGDTINFVGGISPIFTALDQYGQYIDINVYELIMSSNTSAVMVSGNTAHAIAIGKSYVVVNIKDDLNKDIPSGKFTLSINVIK